MENPKELKTVNGKYSKEKMNCYMKQYIATKNEDIQCDLCGGHYKKVTGKHYHINTKKHLIALEHQNENVELKKEVESFQKFKEMMKQLKMV